MAQHGTTTFHGLKHRTGFTHDEVLACNSCGRGFYGSTVLDGPPPAGAPTGICRTCEDLSNHHRRNHQR